MNNVKRMMDTLEKEAIPYKNNHDLTPLIDAIGESQYVLLGEASHGTSEFYTVRAELTKRLIKEKGFSVIAVEGDWPACFTANEFIKGYSGDSAFDALRNFNRWPTWMWANEEIHTLLQWLKKHNEKSHNQVGFYGIDVYSLWESMEEVIRQLENHGKGDAQKARNAFSCFEPFYRKPENYGISAAFYGEHCLEEVSNLLSTIRKNQMKYEKGQEESLNIKVNGLVAYNAEKYYKAMVRGGPDDWNIRDHHMVSAIEEIVRFHGEDTKVIVWEHNTHIGDARATDMAAEGLVNVGQILREKYGDKVYAVGFGTHSGTVIAAKRWGESIEEMSVPVAEEGSWEDILFKSGSFDKYIIFTPENSQAFKEVIGHRAIGVVYNPEYEYLGNYVPTIISERYDAFMFIVKTKALSPLQVKLALH
jgi:erythromycin esterase-like protein